MVFANTLFKKASKIVSMQDWPCLLGPAYGSLPFFRKHLKSRGVPFGALFVHRASTIMRVEPLGALLGFKMGPNGSRRGPEGMQVALYMQDCIYASGHVYVLLIIHMMSNHA